MPSPTALDSLFLHHGSVPGATSRLCSRYPTLLRPRMDYPDNLVKLRFLREELGLDVVATLHTCPAFLTYSLNRITTRCVFARVRGGRLAKGFRLPACPVLFVFSAQIGWAQGLRPVHRATPALPARFFLACWGGPASRLGGEPSSTPQHAHLAGAWETEVTDCGREPGQPAVGIGDAVCGAGGIFHFGFPRLANAVAGVGGRQSLDGKTQRRPAQQACPRPAHSCGPARNRRAGALSGAWPHTHYSLPPPPPRPFRRRVQGFVSFLWIQSYVGVTGITHDPIS